MKQVVISVFTLLVLSFASVHADAAKENFERSKPHLSFFVGSPGLDMRNFDVVVGPGIEVETIEYQDGDDLVLRKRPGRTKYSNITLKRGYRGSSDVEQWAMRATRGRVERQDIVITVIDRKTELSRTYNLLESFPVSWNVSPDEKGQLIETLVFAVGRVELL